MTINIPPARQEDRETIPSFIRQAKVYPRNLHWQNLLVAEDNGQAVGMRQVRVHAEGTREVTSGFVLPEYRRQGISAQLMKEVLSRERGTIHLMCHDRRASYYSFP